MMTTGSRRVVLAVAAATLVVLALVGGYALWGSDSAGPSGAPPSATTPAGDGPVTMAGRAPLTGVPIDQSLDHPAVTVKISDTPDAHPHRGLADADLVFVEPITGATTRLAAIFHSRLPRQAGPVRSLRPMDAPLIGPTRGVIADTMADRWVQQYVDRVADLANLGTLRVPKGTYWIDTARRAPNHVFAQPHRLLRLTERTAPPQPYFDYAADVGRSTAQRSGRVAASVTIGYGGSATATWRYDRSSGTWLRAERWSQHRLEDGRQVSARNVMVLTAARDTSFPRAKESMTILDLVESAGTVRVFTGDKVVDGRWSKRGVNEPFRFTTVGGRPLLLAPGATWVECVLTGMPVQVGTSGPESPMHR